jgi:hypothetical protein
MYTEGVEESQRGHRGLRSEQPGGNPTSEVHLLHEHAYLRWLEELLLFLSLLRHYEVTTFTGGSFCVRNRVVRE